MCRGVSMPPNAPNYVRGDPKLYDYVVRYRELFKKDRVRPEDLGDDMDLGQATAVLRGLRRGRGQALAGDESRSTLDLASSIQNISKAGEAGDALEKFEQWKREMWIRLRQHMKEKEIAARPDYIQKYDEATQQHMSSYWEDLHSRTVVEQGARESLWREPKAVAEFRACISYLFNQTDVGEDELIESLVLVKESLDRQNLFVQEVRDLKFATAVKSNLDQLHDGDVQYDYSRETEKERQLVDELMNVRHKEHFL